MVNIKSDENNIDILFKHEFYEGTCVENYYVILINGKWYGMRIDCIYNIDIYVKPYRNRLSYIMGFHHINADYASKFISLFDEEINDYLFGMNFQVGKMHTKFSNKKDLRTLMCFEINDRRYFNKSIYYRLTDDPNIFTVCKYDAPYSKKNNPIKYLYSEVDNRWYGFKKVNLFSYIWYLFNSRSARVYIEEDQENGKPIRENLFAYVTYSNEVGKYLFKYNHKKYVEFTSKRYFCDVFGE